VSEKNRRIDGPGREHVGFRDCHADSVSDQDWLGSRLEQASAQSPGLAENLAGSRDLGADFFPRTHSVATIWYLMLAPFDVENVGGNPSGTSMLNSKEPAGQSVILLALP
jgi:hypothetical protein